MTAKDWEEFFTLLNQAGQLPTIINAAHAVVMPAADKLPASGEKTTIMNETTKAETANGKMGKALANLEDWGKKHSTQGEVPGPGTPPGGTPPPTTTPTVPTGSTPFVANASSTDTRKVMDKMPQGVVHTIKGKGIKKVSWAIGSGGYPCYLSFDPTFPPNEMNTTGSTGGTGWLNSPDADWTAYLFYTADPGRVQQATVDIYNV